MIASVTRLLPLSMNRTFSLFAIRKRCGGDAVIRRGFAIDDVRPQKGQLEIDKFLPVYDVREKVDVQCLQCIPYVIHGQLGIPTVVEVDSEGAEAQLLYPVGGYRAVHPAADSDNAVVILLPAFRLDLLHQFRERAFAFRSWKELGTHPFDRRRTAVANSLVVETDLGVRCVHNATGANLIRYAHVILSGRTSGGGKHLSDHLNRVVDQNRPVFAMENEEAAGCHR